MIFPKGTSKARVISDFKDYDGHLLNWVKSYFDYDQGRLIFEIKKNKISDWYSNKTMTFIYVIENPYRQFVYPIGSIWLFFMSFVAYAWLNKIYT